MVNESGKWKWGKYVADRVFFLSAFLIRLADVESWDSATENLSSRKYYELLWNLLRIAQLSSPVNRKNVK
jgi:hypothetical protein